MRQPDRPRLIPPTLRRLRPNWPPARPNGDEPTEPGRVYLAVLLCLVVAILVGSSRLVGVAELQPFGPERDAALTVAGGIDGAARAVGLDRPAAMIDGALGRQPTAHAAATTAAPVAPTAQLTVQPTPAVAAILPPPTVSPTVADLPTAARSPAAAGTAVVAAPPMATPAPPIPRPTSAPPTPAPTVAPTATAAPAGVAARAVSPAAPLRVLVAGDSFAEPLYHDLADFAAQDGRLTVKLEYKVSSGLALPEFFDWPARLNVLLTTQPKPEVVVLFLGANDFKIMQVGAKKIEQTTPEWKAEYARRAAAVMDQVGRSGARLYWVGLPVVRDSWRNLVVRDIHEALVAGAATRPWVRLLDLQPLFGDLTAPYSSVRPDRSGEQVRVRQDDGTHLNGVGTTWVSELVIKHLQGDWRLAAERPAALPPGYLRATQSPGRAAARRMVRGQSGMR